MLRHYYLAKHQPYRHERLCMLYLYQMQWAKQQLADGERTIEEGQVDSPTCPDCLNVKLYLEFTND
jgi:hypothetical protein